MPNQSLSSAIQDVVTRRLKGVTDQILRLEASKDWPMLAALQELSAHTPVRVLTRRPFRASEFAGLAVTDDAGEATAWRNMTVRDYGVLIIGSVGGSLDAGLKDVRVVLRREVISAWRDSVIKALPQDGDQSKVEYKALLTHLFSEVERAITPANQLETYLEKVKATPSVETMWGELPLVGLMVDPKALDVGAAKGRAQRNRDLIDLLRTSEDPQIDKALKEKIKDPSAAVAAVAKAAKKFRETGEQGCLRELQAPILEGIFKKTPTQPTGRSLSFVSLLDQYASYPDQVRAACGCLSKAWDLASTSDSVCATFAGAEQTEVKLKLSPATTDSRGGEEDLKLAKAWTLGQRGAPTLAVMSDSEVPVGLDNDPDQKLLTQEMLRAHGVGQPEVEAYLTARANLADYEPWLQANAVELLVLKPEAIQAVDEYIQAWSALAKAAISSDDKAAFVQTIQVLETIAGPAGREDWVQLSPLHPYRLDPVLRASQMIVCRLNEVPSVEKLGEALEWILDKCYPAYPVLHREDRHFAITSSHPNLIYRKSSAGHLPAVKESRGLERILRAIESFSPWLSDGISALVIDPPSGGGVAKAFQSTLIGLRKAENAPVTIHHLATSGESDALDNFEGQVRYLPKVSKLEDATDLPHVNVVIRFVPESPSVCESAGASWQATRGTHLSLQLSESPEGPFAVTSTPKIKIDPRESNLVVRLTQQLYAKQSGGNPQLATVRPLLQTDEAPVLSRMASRTDWVVFAAPGPLGLVCPRTINSTLRFVGKATLGQYGLYAYAANDLYPVRRHFEEYFKTTPVATVTPAKMVELLVAKAQESGQAILFAGMTSVPAQIGCLVALMVAQSDVGKGDEAFILSLDDLGWTRVWLGDHLRADYLVVIIRESEEVVFRVVESKTQESGEKVKLEPDSDPFSEAIGQVRATLASIREIATAAVPSLDQDIRYTSLIEQVMAAVLNRSHELRGARRARVFKVINGLSKRIVTPEFQGLAILSQVGINESQEEKKVDDEVRIIWAGAKDLERTFQVKAYGYQQPGAPAPVARPREALLVRPATAVPTSSAEEGAEPTAGAPLMAAEVTAPFQSEPLVYSPLPNELTALAKSFIAAARIHGIAVGESEPVFIQAGPTLLALGIRLREGATIQPLKARLSDIARDIGLGDRAAEIEVENDAEPRTVRVLLPNPVREFPPLPSAAGQEPLTSGGYLPIYLGQKVDGCDFPSPIEQWPHMLVAGTTGSGKTTFVRSILMQMAAFGPELLQAVIVDGKGDTDYLGLLPESMLHPKFPEVQLGHTDALAVLQWATEEMERRRKTILELARRVPSAPHGVKAADIYREAIRQRRLPEIRPLILVIDEFADIMLANKKSAEEFENLVQRVSQVGRARLMHLILATQRPDKETIRGAIKANLGARAVFHLPTMADSLTVIGQSGAERLMLHGDMLFQHGTAALTRLQGYRV